MTRWMSLAVLALALLLLAEEIHCQADGSVAPGQATKTHRRRFRKVRRQQVRHSSTSTGDADEGNEVHYQRSRVAATDSAQRRAGMAGGGLVPGRGSRRLYSSRVNRRRQTNYDQRGGAGAPTGRAPVLEGSYFLPDGDTGERRFFNWNGGGVTARVNGAGTAGVQTSGQGLAQPSSPSPVLSRTYSSSYYYRSSSGAGGGASTQDGSRAAQAAYEAAQAQRRYGGEPGFAGQPGSLSNVERRTYSRRVTYGTTSGGIPCAEASSCAASAQQTSQAQSQSGYNQQRTYQTHSQTGYNQEQISEANAEAAARAAAIAAGQSSYSQQSSQQDAYTRQQEAYAREYARRQQEYARRQQAYGRRQQQRQGQTQQQAQTSQQYGQTQYGGRQQGGYEQTYDRTYSGQTYDRTGRRDGTERGATVVTRYPGRTVYRNATGTYVNYTRTLPGGGTVTAFNYTRQVPGGSVVTSVNRATYRNRTVVSTSQNVPAGAQRPDTQQVVSSVSQSGAGRGFGGGSGDSGGNVQRTGGSSSSVYRNVTTVYRNESRVVSSGQRPQTSTFEWTDVRVSGSGGGRGRGRERGRDSSITSTRTEQEEVITQEELRRAYQERNRLQTFGDNN